MKVISEEARLGLDLENGARHYRAYVGPAKNYDLCSAIQFNLLTSLGLREEHYLLDIGCGSLRGGKLFIPYLLPGRYYGIEPNQWLIEEGIELELGKDIFKIKEPTIINDNNFSCTTFGVQFDFFLAQSIFTHASERQIKRCFSEIRKSMKENSIIVATFSQGEENYSGEEWVYPPCVFYTIEKMKDLAGEQDLYCNIIEWPHPDEQKWMLVIDNEQDIMKDALFSKINKVGRSM